MASDRAFGRSMFGTRITAVIPIRQSRLLLIVCAILGSVIVVGMAIAAISALWQPRSLQAMLPGNDVVALFSNVTNEDVRVWSDRFPELRKVPVFSGRLELGILNTAAGRGWILSSPIKDEPLPDSNGSYYGQQVLLSDPEVLARMTGNAERLRANEAFLALSAGLFENSTRIYLSEDASTASTLIPTPLRPLISASGAVLIAHQDDSALLRVFGKSTVQMGDLNAMEVPILKPMPEMVLSLSDPATLINTTLDILPPHERDIRTGILAQKAADLLGGEVSPEYDILPLLKNASTLAWTSSGGSLNVLLEGEMNDARALRERLAAFHERFAAEQTGTSVTRHTFTHGFASAILKSDSASVVEKQYSAGGWTVRETGNGQQTLLSAVHGTAFIMTNNAQWLKQTIAGGTSEMPPTPGGTRFAQGALSPQLLKTLTADHENTPVWTWLRNGSQPAKQGNALWAAEFHGHVMTLSFTLPQL